MNSSFKIDYRIRPAKCVEIKMIVESLRCLDEFYDLSDYQYIGFGGNYFTEYYYLHKELHINKLISIERNINNKDRFEYNKPFENVEIKFGSSTNILQEIDYSIPSIVWLDYDGNLDSNAIKDIATLVSNLISGSMFFVTFREKFSNKPAKQLMRQLKNEFGDKIPYNLNPKDVVPKNINKIYHKIINLTIDESIKIRDNYIYEQKYFFRYKDTSNMMTIGGLLYLEDDKAIFENCCFNDFPYIVNDDKYFEIGIPILTNKEITFLNQSIESETVKLNQEFGLSNSEIEKYKNLYKYYPHFSEIKTI